MEFVPNRDSLRHNPKPELKSSERIDEKTRKVEPIERVQRCLFQPVGHGLPIGHDRGGPAPGLELSLREVITVDGRRLELECFLEVLDSLPRFTRRQQDRRSRVEQRGQSPRW